MDINVELKEVKKIVKEPRYILELTPEEFWDLVKVCGYIIGTYKTIRDTTDNILYEGTKLLEDNNPELAEYVEYSAEGIKQIMVLGD